MPKGLSKNHTEKEIVSAMVRLNQDGHEVPVNLNELKNLPKIPQSGAQVHNLSIQEIQSAHLRSLETDKYLPRGIHPKFMRNRNKYADKSMTIDTDYHHNEEESYNVFDLVHRGR